MPHLYISTTRTNTAPTSHATDHEQPNESIRPYGRDRDDEAITYADSPGGAIRDHLLETSENLGANWIRHFTKKNVGTEYPGSPDQQPEWTFSR